jgi:hypothetical protein
VERLSASGQEGVSVLSRAFVREPRKARGLELERYPPHLCIPTTPAEEAGKFCWGDPVSDMAYVLVHEGLSYTQAFCVADTDADDARFAGQFQLLLGAVEDGNPAAAERFVPSGEC